MALTMKSDKLNFTFKTPLGPDELIVLQFSGHEQISNLFHFTLELKSYNSALDFDSLVGKHATLSICKDSSQKRSISGYISHFRHTTQNTDMSTYVCELVPWLWFLTLRSDCKIFQEKNVLDIITKIFDDAGFSGKYENKCTASYDKRDYCVQYRETDFNFVSRLMEEEGICYYFTHSDGDHKLILADSPSGHTPMPLGSDVQYAKSEAYGTTQQMMLTFSCQHSVCTNAVTFKDFNFEKPSTNLTVSEKQKGTYEHYDYPLNYSERPQGTHLAKVKLQQSLTFEKLFSATSTDRRLACGHTFTLKDHPRSSFNDSYLLVSVSHSASQLNTEEPTYENSCICIPSATQFRPEQVARKPVVNGLQTAIVCGASGEEIYLDKYGRVKVQFHWDRIGEKNEKSSCWIRVAQNWAGKNWGIIFHPRIGQEVLVSFLEGDPDNPIITGRVYNEEQMPPYELPANGTVSTIKSRSSKSGTPDNFNEIRFEDKKGEEHLFIHAEKDQMIEVENDESHWVGHDRTKTIDNDETTYVKGNRTETVDKDETITINGNRTESVEKNETISITKNRDETVHENESVRIEKNRTHSIGKHDKKDVGNDWLVNVGDKIILKCGESSISMKSDGTIQIVGKDIKVQGSGKIDVKASNDITMKGKNIKQN